MRPKLTKDYFKDLVRLHEGQVIESALIIDEAKDSDTRSNARHTRIEQENKMAVTRGYLIDAFMEALSENDD